VFAALVPPGVVTSTLTAPAAWAGVVQVMLVALTTLTLVAAVPPMVTPVAPVKPVPVIVTLVPPAVLPVGGLMTVTVGAGVPGATVKVVLALLADAVFPATSLAVPAAMVMPSVPVPVMLLRVTVRVVPEPVTATVPSAVPVLFNVMLPTASVLALKAASAYVTV
jgi:hypothetical protein